jgi:hypothetical protein
MITDPGGQLRCFIVPPSDLPKSALVNVTDATAGQCVGGNRS